MDEVSTLYSQEWEVGVRIPFPVSTLIWIGSNLAPTFDPLPCSIRPPSFPPSFLPVGREKGESGQETLQLVRMLENQRVTSTGDPMLYRGIPNKLMEWS
ncbi:hypothetical protein CEXT_681061 [Caerostris extrusa]|uniref:Uncharacterized protein n=1 Tax=Caerostris extrusa TaxID=172846 RepID=A0AAV4WL28_CAEEX|nr:hypothetical protein CEXT_681061 [Caerostris extrusa]